MYVEANFISVVSPKYGLIFKFIQICEYTPGFYPYRTIGSDIKPVFSKSNQLSKIKIWFRIFFQNDSFSLSPSPITTWQLMMLFVGLVIVEAWTTETITAISWMTTEQHWVGETAWVW